MCLLVSRHPPSGGGWCSSVTKQEPYLGKRGRIALVSETQKEIILEIYISMQIQWILQHFASGGRAVRS